MVTFTAGHHEDTGNPHLLEKKNESNFVFLAFSRQLQQ